MVTFVIRPQTQHNIMEDIVATKEKFRFRLPSPERMRKLSIRIGKLFIFYIFFYSFLAAFWIAYMYIFFASQKYDKLILKLDESLIGTVPGTTFRPIDNSVTRLVINTKSVDHQVDQLIDMLAPYHVPLDRDDNPHVENCTGDAYASNQDNFCYFDINHLPKECTAQHKFGLAEGRPCIMIRLNRIFSWLPEPYDSSDLQDISLPQVVREDFNRRKEGSRLIYLTCKGQTPTDVSNLDGGNFNSNSSNILYYPYQGVEYRYFPYRDQPGYLSPFVFVRFVRPVHGVDIKVECRWWSKNIYHDISIAHGALNFKLRID